MVGVGVNLFGWWFMSWCGRIYMFEFENGIYVFFIGIENVEIFNIFKYEVFIYVILNVMDEFFEKIF